MEGQQHLCGHSILVHSGNWMEQPNQTCLVIVFIAAVGVEHNLINCDWCALGVGGIRYSVGMNIIPRAVVLCA
jgi:hypothetical protein